MISKALGSSNDLIIENGKIRTVSNAAEVVQSVRTRLQFYLGEWFLNVEVGTPYHQAILVKPADVATIEAIIRERILATPGVDKLNGFSLSYSKRNLTITYSANTTYGTINEEEVLINA